jgi:ATP-binding cassette subfamily C exporter for protease/lipase
MNSPLIADVLRGLALRHAKPVVAMALAAAVLVLAPSWYMMEVYDRVINSRNLMTLGMLTLAVLLLIAMLELIEWWRANALAQVAREWDDAVALPVCRRAFEHGPGQRAQAGMQALAHVQTFRGFIVSPALTGLIDAPAALLFLAMLWAIHPVLSLVALLAAGVQAFSAWRLHQRSGELMRRTGQWTQSTQAFAERMLRQSPVLRALGMWPAVLGRWQERQGKTLQHQGQLQQQVVGHQVFARWLQQAVGSVLLGLACWLLLERSLGGGPGMLIVASILGGRVVAPLFQVVTHWNQVMQARTAVTDLSQMLDGAAATVKDALPLPAPRGVLAVEQLVVASPVRGAAPLLKGLSWRLQPGEMLAVVGGSGAGKTTLARALLGLLPPAAGAVRLDGVDVSIWDRRELGPHLGYLPQFVELLDGTLADNIARFGTPDAERLQAAIAAAGLQEQVSEWPDGVNTELGEGGQWLSGGIRQRVGLARALYGDPVLLVLDEPNASLDRAGDAALAEAIESLKARGRTVVVMSHRSDILRLADHMLVLRDGQQVAFGPREEVMAALRKANAAAAQPTAATAAAAVVAQPVGQPA